MVFFFYFNVYVGESISFASWNERTIRQGNKEENSED